jgi:hypothetical protein
MLDFVHFRDLDPIEEKSWRAKCILSIDVDWASDDVLADTIDLVEEAGVKACFFVTHRTHLLKRLRANPAIELGLHPNFDPLLRGEDGRTAERIVAEIAAIAPDAHVLRSHAMTTSGRWLELFTGAGMSHISNYVMFAQRYIRPFRHVNGLVEVPVFFADDGILYQRSRAIENEQPMSLLDAGPGLQVYNFHPIHLFLNSESHERYEKARVHLRNTEALRELRGNGDGARNWFGKLLSNRS